MKEKRKYKKGKREKEGRDESEWDKSDENEKPAKSWDWKWYQELSEGSDLEYKKANSRQGISKKQQKRDTGKKERMKIEYSEEESEEGWQATQGEYGKGIQEGHQNKWKQQGKQLEKRERETKKKFYPPDTFARDDKQGNTKRGRDRRWEYLKEDKRRVKKRNWVHISSGETESSEDGKQDMRNRYQQIQEQRKREEKNKSWEQEKYIEERVKLGEDQRQERVYGKDNKVEDKQQSKKADRYMTMRETEESGKQKEEDKHPNEQKLKEIETGKLTEDEKMRFLVKKFQEELDRINSRGKNEEMKEDQGSTRSKKSKEESTRSRY